ncbi:uncharacterized protein A1O9_05193, partial [Exophiala aquamarina CBS 119918]
MPPKGASTAVKPIRLQSVSHLRIKHPDQQQPNPCLGPMTAMLNCWAAAGAAGGCQGLEKALRDCMDAPVCPLLPSEGIHIPRIYLALELPLYDS